MKNFRMEGVVPLPLDTVWTLLHAHLDEDRIREIHPSMRSGATVHEGETVEFHGLRFPREKVAKRAVQAGFRSVQTTWRYSIAPPDRYAYEIEFANGSRIAIENTYVEAEWGTLVTTVGQVSIRLVPSFVAVWLVKRSLNRSDDEDLAYARKMGL